MTTTRTLCPLDCGWHHDQADFDPTVPQPFASEPAPEGVDPLVWGYSLGRTLVVENALKAHLETHELIEWVTALTTAQRRVANAEAQVARIRAFLEDMAGGCSPHGVAAGYARRGLDSLNGVDRLRDARACSCGRSPDPGICPIEHSAQHPAGGHCACACDKETP